MIATLFRGYLACISIIQQASATPKYGGGGLYFTAGFLSALSLHYIKVPSWDSLTGVAGFMGHHNNLPTYRIAENLGLVPRRKVAVLFGGSITQYGNDPANEGWVAALSNFWYVIDRNTFPYLYRLHNGIHSCCPPHFNILCSRNC